MLDAAIDFFADNGFAASTRDLARHLGVTQALIYKHFGSKQEFIASLLDRVFTPGVAPNTTALADAAIPLAERLAAFYSARRAGQRSRFRLFVRAGLEGWSTPARHGARLTNAVFAPIVAALRAEAGLPRLDEHPLMRGEREIVMMLHASIIFLGIREHIYRMPMPGDRDGIVRLYVDIYLPGALAAIKQLHHGEGADRLALTQLAPTARGRGRS